MFLCSLCDHRGHCDHSGENGAGVRVAKRCVFACAVVLTVATLAACGDDSADPVEPVVPTPPVVDTTPLRTLADRRGLRIGTAIDRGFRLGGNDGTRFRGIVAREFNALTAENDMKHERIHPARTTYRFVSADSLVAFAEANSMRVRGHTLVWHSQLAPWLTSGTWTRDEATALLTDHIDNVVGHYRGRVVEWDVVNEPFNDNGSLRSGFWLDRVGRDYIELAFRRAAAADPNASLFLTDYNIEGVNAKSDSAFVLIRDLRARGVPIHGVGLQGHFQVGGVPSTLGANIARFAALGVKVHIVELDVRIPLPATPSLLQTQADNYREVIDVCLQSPACGLVTIWGFTDRDSWVPNTFPGWGDALPFDSFYEPKLAYWAIHNRLK